MPLSFFSASSAQKSSKSKGVLLKVEKFSKRITCFAQSRRYFGLALGTNDCCRYNRVRCIGVQASNTLDRGQSSQITLRVQLLHQLAQCEMEEELSAAAQTTISKALATDCFGAPDALQKSEQLGQFPNNMTANPVVATCCALEVDSLEVVEWGSQSLSCCLERMRETIASLSPARGGPIDQLQQLAFRGKHERSLVGLVDMAESLRHRALQQISEEENQKALRHGGADRRSTSKRIFCSPNHDRTSVSQKEVLSWKAESDLKKLIASFSCLVNRSLELGNIEATARASAAILSMVHGIEGSVSSFRPGSYIKGIPCSTDLRVRLRTPLDTEVAVSVIQAAYALVSYCS